LELNPEAIDMYRKLLYIYYLRGNFIEAEKIDKYVEMNEDLYFQKII